ncbi:hypothetical protein QM857_04205 [Streptococcus infantis]|uniref:hypothetical protein n=1 Tax=Streptococcus infantis TaxID=68892 RepID=UPI0039C3C681
MKQQNEFYAIAKKGTNSFLTKYQNNERALTFSASYSKDIRFALIFEKSNDETNESIQNIAKAFGGRLDWSPTSKALLDGLTDAKFWTDDNYHVIKSTDFRHGGKSGNKKYRIELEITEWKEADK